MEILVRGKNRAVSEHLRLLSREKVSRISRLVRDASRVEVDYSEIRNPREARPQECEVTVHLKRHFVKARAAAPEPEAALDLVLDKVDRQIARIKDKRVSRNHPRRGREPSPNGAAPASVPDGDGDGDMAIGVDAGADGADHADGPRIVKTKRFAAKPMDPEEAALQMDLLGHAFFLFTNTETGRAALLYRRADGDLGLIEST